MGAKIPDSFELVTPAGEQCNVVKHQLTKLKNPIRLQYVADITLWEDGGNFDIDFTLYPRRLYANADDVLKESVHLMESKAVLKMAVTEEQLKEDKFFKELFRDFLSKHFDVHPLDLLIRVIYDENNYPETVKISFNAERLNVAKHISNIDVEFCSYLYERCIARPNLFAS